MGGGPYLQMLGRLSPHRFAEMMLHYDESRETQRYVFFLEKDPRLMIAKMLLFGIAGWVAMILLLQAFIFQVNGLPNELSMFLAVLAVFLSFMEKKLDTIVDSPETFIWATIMLKVIKAWFTVTVFVLNGTANDFYIGVFFLTTSSHGAMYFYIDSTKRPSEHLGNNKTEVELKLKECRQKILEQIFSTYEGSGYSAVVITTIIVFLIMMGVALYSPFIPEEILGLRAPETYVPTSLGFSSTILILYNAISWPGIKGTMMKTQVHEESTVIGRAKLVLGELDVIIVFCSTLMNMINDGAKKAELGMNELMPFKAFILVLYTKPQYD